MGKESELATRVMKWLADDGWDCYPEVQIHSMSRRADIVAVYKGKLVWIIEAKMSLSLAVLDQATYWLGLAHWVSIAVPKLQRGSHSHAARSYLNWQGIGLLSSASSEPGRDIGWGIYEEVAAPLHRRNSSDQILARLHPDMKRYTPGTQTGYSTPYRRTMDGVRALIARHPGCTIKDIMQNLPSHHYSSNATARSCIRVALASFEKDIEIKQDGKEFRYYLAVAINN